jgi:hypothetical protein
MQITVTATNTLVGIAAAIVAFKALRPLAAVAKAARTATR